MAGALSSTDSPILTGLLGHTVFNVTPTIPDMGFNLNLSTPEDFCLWKSGSGVNPPNNDVVALAKLNLQTVWKSLDKFGTWKREWDWNFAFKLVPARSPDEPQKFNITGTSELLGMLFEVDANIKVKFHGHFYSASNPEIAVNVNEDMPVTLEEESSSAKYVTRKYICQWQMDGGQLLSLMRGHENLCGSIWIWYKILGDANPLAPIPLEESKEELMKYVTAKYVGGVRLISKDCAPLPWGACHEDMIAVHTDSFKSKFTPPSGPQRFMSNRRIIIKMPDLDENGLRAMFYFMYFWELTAAQESSLIAAQLFAASSRHKISSIRVALVELILRQPVDWFESGAAMKMFTVASEMIGGAALVQKLLAVLKSQEVGSGSSPAVQTLFREAPEVAMRLAEAALKTSGNMSL